MAKLQATTKYWLQNVFMDYTPSILFLVHLKLDTMECISKDKKNHELATINGVW